MKIFHSNKEKPQFIVMILEYFILKTEWLEMKCGKSLYQHSFQDKWIQVKWDMQAKPQIVQCNSLHVAWRDFCQKKFCKSSRYFVFLIFHISIQSLKRNKFSGKSKEQCSFNQSNDWLATQCICTLKLNISNKWYSLTVAMQVSPSVSNSVSYTDWLF